MKTIQFFACALIITAFLACSEKTEDKKQEQPSFSIAGTQEQVLVKFDDGKPKLVLYTDSLTQMKRAEVEFHNNGQPKIYKKFEGESLNGESWCYYEDGKPWSLNTFANGILEGPYKAWHDNGNLHIQGQYSNGKEVGEWFTYYPSGSINTRGIYKDGNKVGIWTSYNLEGTMKREQDFGEGK